MGLQKINKIILALSLSTLLVSCIHRLQTNIEVVDPGLAPYVKDYHKLLDQYCPNKHYNTSKYYEIKFVKEIKKVKEDYITIGMCARYINGYMIEINKSSWNSYTNDHRRELIYHELSHCILDIDHSSDPNNYMYFATGFVYPKVLVSQVVADIETRCNKND